MKYISRISLGIFTITALLFTSCEQDNEQAIYKGSNIGATFATATKSVSLPSTGVTSFEVELLRAETSEAASVALQLQDESGLFTIPANAVFEAGTDRTMIKVEIGALLSGKKYKISISVPTELAAPSGSRVKTITVEKDYVYNYLGTGSIDSSSMAAEGEDYASWDVEFELADRISWYRALDLFEEGKNIIIKVDGDKVIVDKQAAWTDSSYGVASVAGKGKISGGVITLKLEHTVSAGSFGEYTEIIHLPAGN